MEAEFCNYSLLFTIYSVIKEFTGTYIVDNGVRHGATGFSVAVMDVLYHVMIYVY
jgi:hypothetical protein